MHGKIELLHKECIRRVHGTDGLECCSECSSTGLIDDLPYKTKKMENNDNNNSAYLLSAHSIFDAYGANYYYPGYAWLSQRCTPHTRKNPTGTYLLHLGRERQLSIKYLV